MQHDDELSRAASETMRTINRAVSSLAGRIQDMLMRRQKDTARPYKPHPAAGEITFRRACLRAIATLHTYSNGYERSNPAKFAHFIEDVRTIAATISPQVSGTMAEAFNLDQD